MRVHGGAKEILTGRVHVTFISSWFRPAEGQGSRVRDDREGRRRHDTPSASACRTRPRSAAKLAIGNVIDTQAQYPGNRRRVGAVEHGADHRRRSPRSRPGSSPPRTTAVLAREVQGQRDVEHGTFDVRRSPADIPGRREGEGHPRRQVQSRWTHREPKFRAPAGNQAMETRAVLVRHHQALGVARHWPTTASRSSAPGARCSRCWARTAPASRRWWRSCSATTADAAGSRSTAGAAAGSRPKAALAAASAWSTSTSRWPTTCPCSTT